MHETPLGPSTSGSVVLELGPGIGALVLHTPPELDGAEIDIGPVSPPADPVGLAAPPGPDAPDALDALDALDAPADPDDPDAPADLAGKRTHSQVRQRITPRGTSFAAVYPNLAAGEYTIWRDATTPAMTVTVHGGQVTSARWPGY